MNSIVNKEYKFFYAGFFRTEGEWIHPERVEHTYELIYVTHGEVYMREGDTDIEAKRGDVIILSPNVTHTGTRVTSNVGFYWVHFHFSGELPCEKRYFRNFENAYLFKELLHISLLPQRAEYLENALLMHLLAELCFLSGEGRSSIDGRAEKLYEWVRINATARLTVASVADHFGYTPDHLSRICKSTYGMGTRELINKFLVLHAKELLLNTDKYVKEIAAELGFTSDKAFIGYFKYHEGCFPTEYRNRYSRTKMNNE